MLEKILESIAYIHKRVTFRPETGIILGSGLGALVKNLSITEIIGYGEIPNFPVSTVKGHRSELIFGTLEGRDVVVMNGRFHFYEGYTPREIAFPVWVMRAMGISTLVISNAAGAVNTDYRVGDLMLIKDHINLIPGNPLIGENINEFGPRFPEMSEAYDKEMILKASKIAVRNNISCHKGVYAAVAGPCYETPAEYRYMKIIGADAVGMSTVPEVIAARHSGIKCFGISVITDVAEEDFEVKITHDEVVEAANNAAPKLTLIVRELLKY
ncbi:MAG: purine-nucleoside phosphorylase [Bacteroidota bacterium]|nr:purine-nucleoside phosphorylase [Bacteroidota bacterium]